jgi:hypothetical protein
MSTFYDGHGSQGSQGAIAYGKSYIGAGGGGEKPGVDGRQCLDKSYMSRKDFPQNDISESCEYLGLPPQAASDN